MSGDERRDGPPSPCRQVCRMGVDGLCDGCGRSIEEIAGWLCLTAAQRNAVMFRVRNWEPRA